jgi:RNA polymerase sigma-70 factor (ECF subfamily)
MTRPNSNLSDEDLARESQAGSLAAFEELVYRYEKRVLAFVTNYCKNPVDARETTQDTLVRAFQALGSFDSRRSFPAWLFAIARRKCIDRARRDARFDFELPHERADGDDPGRLLARREESQQLWAQARRCLPEAQFAALWLRYAEDMSIADAARTLGRTQTHVKVLLFRARNALARELKNWSEVREQNTPVQKKAAQPVGKAAPSASLTRGNLKPTTAVL